MNTKRILAFPLKTKVNSFNNNLKDLPQDHREKHWKDEDLDARNCRQNDLGVLIAQRNNIQKEGRSILSSNLTDFDQIADCVQETVEHNRRQSPARNLFFQHPMQ
jgi:hypothetical protein